MYVFTHVHNLAKIGVSARTYCTLHSFHIYIYVSSSMRVNPVDSMRTQRTTVHDATIPTW